MYKSNGGKSANLKGNAINKSNSWRKGCGYKSATILILTVVRNLTRL